MRHVGPGALLALLFGGQALAASPSLTLETIMADPDWMGTPVRDAYWSVDGSAAYYSRKREGAPLVDLHRIDLGNGADRLIDGVALSQADGAPVFAPGNRRAAFVRHGDVFLREGGRLRQVSKTGGVDGAPQFSADGTRLSFREKTQWYVHEVGSGLTAPAALVEARKDPDAEPDADDLRDFQLRTFSTLRRQREEKLAQLQAERDQRRADATRAAAPFFLGDDLHIDATSLSPDGRYLLVVTSHPSAPKGREGQLTRYVTESGYEEFETERVRVGRNPTRPQALWMLDLVHHEIHALKTDSLPGIEDDPLRAVREENARLHPAVKPERATGARGIVVVGEEGAEDEIQAPAFAWSGDGKALAMAIFAIDNKDRWIATVDFANFTLVTQHRLSDSAWVNAGPGNDLGWLNDNRTLWYQSEESGYSHLYVKRAGESAVALTHGHFEVSAPVLSSDGRYFYLLANESAPYSYDVYRVPAQGGALSRLTHLEGVEHFVLQPGSARVLLIHSSPYVRPQLALLEPGGRVRELTDTRSSDYRARQWIVPDMVQIPSSHGAAPIYGKLYRAAGEQPKPAVLFVHGAGYLQDVSRRFTYYFREQMFNNLLVQHGYDVLDIDYRASQGYGRDWRTAIYRQMGTPELEDLLDAKHWLVANAGADPQRFGIYGGSYGGFMALMALFRAPGEFKAGAALRPVTDWMQYDKDYTSAILNDPQVDPIAYARSSPLEFAAGLQDALLICHGVIDDNVLFEDSMRLYQRLIELHKDNFTISPYPLDRHGFANADSWLDEYRRIYRLFDSNLKAP